MWVINFLICRVQETKDWGVQLYIWDSYYTMSEAVAKFFYTSEKEMLQGEYIGIVIEKYIKKVVNTKRKKHEY